MVQADQWGWYDDTRRAWREKSDGHLFLCITRGEAAALLRQGQALSTGYRVAKMNPITGEPEGETR